MKFGLPEGKSVSWTLMIVDKSPYTQHPVVLLPTGRLN
jgi:hypothetical protein